MAEWLVKLIGEDLDLEVLAREFSASSPGIIKDEQGYWLKSSEFVSFNDGEKIRTLANELLPIINGAGRVFLAGFQPVEAGHVVQIGDNGTRHNFMSFTASVSFRASVVGEATDAAENPKPPPLPLKDVEFALALAHSDERVKRALTFFSREHTWVNLYKVYELIKADVDGENNMVARGLSTDDEMNRFRRTANSVSAAGDEARHAVETTVPPPKPMSLKEGEQFIRSLLTNWILSKK